MFLAEKTVKNYVSNLLAKLGMHRRTEVAALAARLDERRRAGDAENEPGVGRTH
jgi:DNA-binding NarL/FixJ family response regulator